jgi:hypothetical protein
MLAGMASGLILLLLLGGAAVFFWTRVRGKLKFSAPGKGWQGVLIVFVLVVVLLYVTHRTGTGTAHR